ncbi:ribonuclease H-like domain-containing protein [Tanacetum coccineum]|uniref:Ribonuclease H-like domain-containing protein n=1 Tax=Tanacetum coccineum TaxID=301880 RepID=A0ABQ4ZXF2_9ASTR
MTGSDVSQPSTPLFEKLSLVTHHHLLTRVPDKLDLDNWNYGSWEYFFEQLCESYDVVKFIRAHAPDINTSAPTPFTPEELKIDKIMLSWILFTLFDSLRARLVLARPKSAKEAWSLISEIVKDNKRSCTNALKAELRSIKLGDQSMESYFQKIDSIVNILTSLDAHVNDEDVIHYALEGLPETYANVCGYMHWKDTFPDLKTVQSLLLTEEMRLKPKVLSSSMDSSSLMVFVADSSNNSRSSSTTQGKSWKPCFNFAKGNCRFGASCRYVHDVNARVTNTNSGIHKGRNTSDNSTHDLLNKLITQLGNLGMNMSSTGSGSNATVSPSIGPTTTPSRPIAYYASPSPTGPTTPPGFTMPAHVLVSYPAGPTHYASSTVGYSAVGQAQTPQPGSTTATHNSGQATVLPHAFTAGTLQDPSTGAWNMDTGASSHLNNHVTSLSTVLNSCMYSTVSVGDGHSIPVTNTGHSILPTPLKSLRLNNVLITPHIVLLRCDSTGDLYLVTAPSPIPHAFLVSQHMWHRRLGHPGSDVLRRLVSNNVISCNKEKPPVLCHACQLGKHVRLPFVSSNTIASSCFDIVHSDVWTSPIPSLSGFQYYVLFLDHYSQFVWVYPLVRKSDVLSKFILFRNYVRTQFKCEIRAFQCDHGGEFDNRNLHDLFNTHGIQFRFSCPKTSQQNGKSERMVRTLNNIIRTLLFQAKLPPTY